MHFHGCTYIKIFGSSEKIRLEGAGEGRGNKKGKDHGALSLLLLLID